MAKKGMLDGPHWRVIIADMLEAHVDMIPKWAGRIPGVREGVMDRGQSTV